MSWLRERRQGKRKIGCRRFGSGLLDEFTEALKGVIKMGECSAYRLVE
jgi:hypothetical protein